MSVEQDTVRTVSPPETQRGGPRLVKVVLLAGIMLALGGWIYGRRLAPSLGRHWIVAVQVDGPMEKDRALVEGAVNTLRREFVGSQDHLSLILFDQEATLQPVGTLPAKEPLPLTFRPKAEVTQPSAGLAAARAARKAGREQNPRRPTVLLFITNGMDRFPPGQGSHHESEMRTQERHAEGWKAEARPEDATVLAGVITHPTAHWRIARLGKKLGAQVVLLRSERSVADPLAEFRQVVREATERRPSRWGRLLFSAVLGIGLLGIVLQSVQRQRRQEQNKGRLRPAAAQLEFVARVEPADAEQNGAEVWERRWPERLVQRFGCLSVVEQPEVRVHLGTAPHYRALINVSQPGEWGVHLEPGCEVTLWGATAPGQSPVPDRLSGPHDRRLPGRALQFNLHGHLITVAREGEAAF
jgi:hypothetical protein